MKIVISLALVLCQGTTTTVWAARPRLDVGTVAPTFKARNLVTREYVTLDSQRGKLVILTFWATWCAPCRRELPMLERVQEILGKDRVAVLAVNFEDNDVSVTALKKLASTWQISLLEDWNGRIAEHYDITSIPHLFMIDREGKIVANHTGYGDSSMDELVADINAALRASATTQTSAATPATSNPRPTASDPPPADSH